MIALRRLALTLMIVSAAACGSKKKNGAGSGSASASDNGSASGTASGSTASGSGSASASGSGSASASGSAAASGSGSGSASDSATAVDTTNMAHKAGNCPATVLGAAISVDKSPDGKGLVLAISSTNKDAVWAIQTRAKHLADVQNAPDAKVEHTGKGTGGGASGVCPVVTKDTTITVKETADGVSVTMVPSGSLTLDALRADVDQRIKKSVALIDETVHPSSAGKGGAGTGGGAGKHGGNRTGKGDGSGPRGSGAGSAKAM